MDTIEMTTITFIEADGQAHSVEATPGDSLMRVAINASVPGILAECGGVCACATCHIFIPADWAAKIPPAGDFEAGMIEGAIDPGPDSRLACQITVTDELDGMAVRLPIAQI
jgi:ferredoxin, 2Fe-2S